MNYSILDAIALSVRSLSMDAVQSANSGHPGLPMGLAELGAMLYARFLSHYPPDPHWPNRDRFVLSAGHGSMLLYSLLHLSGYDLPLEELRRFRTVGSKTPGHPEYGHTVGVEATTGPLGQGISNAVGMAIAERFLAGKFNTKAHPIIDHYTYVIASDGDLMEGISSEASSLAGHLKLDKLIVFYDDNRISIEGSTKLAFSEDVLGRYRSYGWETGSVDAYDYGAVTQAVETMRGSGKAPIILKVRSLIGKGSPGKEGTAGVHGAALGNEEIVATRRNLGLREDQAFYVPPEVPRFFKERLLQLKERYRAWQDLFREWAGTNPSLKRDWDRWHGDGTEALAQVELPQFPVGKKIATRSASGAMLQAVARKIDNLIGGSADLAPSNNTALPEYGDFRSDNPTGRTLHFGVREHAMGAICNGIAAHKGVRPFCATFLIFSDYMRGSMRLAALMGLPIIYILTHDSIFLGEDGPTHQPVEHLAALRAIPNMRLLRPGDAEETVQAWLMALSRHEGPTVLALTRQGLPIYPKHDSNWRTTIRSGAYIVRDADSAPKTVLLATGSEVSLALRAIEALEPQLAAGIRVVSMPSRELFLSQSSEFRQRLLPPGARVIVVEAGIAQGWEQFALHPGDLFTINRFGASGAGADVAESLGFDAQSLRRLIEKSPTKDAGLEAL